jgi:serine beta-lactamase-like protein LACTB, mitochondrial
MMKVKSAIAPAISALLLCGLGVASAAQTGRIAPEKKQKLGAAVAKFAAANHVPGISVAVVENGAEDWAAGFGSADLENSVPATAQTLYRLASISKPITATAAMLLWQQEKLDLDAPVQKYCPAFPQKDATITTREVLGHLAGIRAYKSWTQDDVEYGNTRHFADTVQAGLDFFKSDPLISKPSAEFHYTTDGFTLVGCAIEGASGEKYVDYVRSHLLLPAGMTHTMPDDRFAIIPLRARFYSKDKTGTVINADFLDSSYKIPGGGWLSSADDVAAFEVAMMGDRILTQATRDLMWTPLATADGKKTGYALGWGTGDELGVRDVGHGGGQQGTTTFFMIVPERRAGVVVLMNMDDGDATGLAFELMRILLADDAAKH